MERKGEGKLYFEEVEMDAPTQVCFGFDRVATEQQQSWERWNNREVPQLSTFLLLLILIVATDLI